MQTLLLSQISQTWTAISTSPYLRITRSSILRESTIIQDSLRFGRIWCCIAARPYPEAISISSSRVVTDMKRAARQPLTAICHFEMPRSGSKCVLLCQPGGEKKWGTQEITLPWVRMAYGQIDTETGFANLTVNVV